MPGQSQLDEQISISKDQRIGGFAIGILMLDDLVPLVPGNVSNASTYNFPVLYKILEGVTAERMFKADPSVIDDVIRGGKELEKQGVRAIAGACGFLLNYQKKAAEALSVPVFLSSLLQIPLISRSLKPGQKVGIITANSRSLTSALLSACGVDDPSAVVIAGFQDLPEAKNLTLCTGNYNHFKIEQELVTLAKQLVKDNPDIRALLLECSDLPTYAWSIQNATKLPVFDYYTLLNWVYNGIIRRPFAGFM